MRSYSPGVRTYQNMMQVSSHSLNPLNVASLIHLYPNCLAHIIDTDGKLDVDGHILPLISSDLKGTRNFRPGLANVRYFRCILSIVTHFLSWEYRTRSLTYEMLPVSCGYFDMRHPTRDCVSIFPQIAVIFTNQRTTSFMTHLLRKKDLPTIFILRIRPIASGSFHIRGEFFCVQCTKARRIYDLQKQKMTFDCTSLRTCGATMEDVRRNNTESLHGGLWIHSQRRRIIGGDHGNVVFCHPCAEEDLLLGIDSELTSFLTKSNLWNPIENYGYPEIQKLVHGQEPSSPIDTIPVGTTADLKFVTTAGVYCPRASHQVYFSPFDFTVWLFFLLSICLSALVMTLVSVQMYHLQSQERPRLIIMEFIVWTLLTTIGQYKHANIPIIPSQMRGFGGISIVVVAWFVTSTFLVNVYSAIFSSDATVTFRYKTNYSKFLDMPIMTTYALVDQQLIELFLDPYPNEMYIVNKLRIKELCEFIGMSLPQCSIIDAASHLKVNLFESYFHRVSSKMDDDEVLKDYGRRMQEIGDKLDHVRDNLTFVCDNAKIVSQMLEKETDPVVFLIYDHDFQKYWELFLKVMKLNPKIKVASNFEDQESFLVQPIAYSFTSGLDPVYQGSVLPKMKMLMSSGIYAFWEKWHRMKFTAGGLRHDQLKLQSSNNVQPLSFDNSGTLLLFVAQQYGWCVGVCVFVAEILTRRVPCSAIIH